MHRNKTKRIRIGDRYIGGGENIPVQSMTNTFTKDVEKTIEQILKLEEAGCDIVRVAVTDNEDAKAIDAIKRSVHIPIVADIQFDYRLAIESIRNGADKIRINPGNIGSRENVEAIVKEAKLYGIPIRTGVNSGSLEKDIIKKYGGVTSQGLIESAMDQVRLLESLDFYDIVISIKCTDVMQSIESHEMLSEITDHPIHLGITEAGTVFEGSIRSAVGMGIILQKGIGDTIRVSLTGDPVEEVRTGIEILKSLELRKKGVQVYSCPTCGRTRIDLIGLAEQVVERVKDIDLDLKVAVMGCAVNGPGEAKEADIGIAGGINEGLLIKKGKIIRKIPEDMLVDELIKEIENWEN